MITDDEKILVTRALVGEREDLADEIFPIYLRIAAKKIIQRAYPYDDEVTEVPERYDYKQCEIAAYLINKRGAEGQTSHTENSITRQYENADVPESLMRDIVPHVGVPR